MAAPRAMRARFFQYSGARVSDAFDNANATNGRAPPSATAAANRRIVADPCHWALNDGEPGSVRSRQRRPLSQWLVDADCCQMVIRRLADGRCTILPACFETPGLVSTPGLRPDPAARASGPGCPPIRLAIRLGWLASSRTLGAVVARRPRLPSPVQQSGVPSLPRSLGGGRSENASGRRSPTAMVSLPSIRATLNRTDSGRLDSRVRQSCASSTTPAAPEARHAAAECRPMPPCAQTGNRVSCNNRCSRMKVVSSPTIPPDSCPFAMNPSRLATSGSPSPAVICNRIRFGPFIRVRRRTICRARRRRSAHQ